MRRRVWSVHEDGVGLGGRQTEVDNRQVVALRRYAKEIDPTDAARGIRPAHHCTLQMSASNEAHLECNRPRCCTSHRGSASSRGYSFTSSQTDACAGTLYVILYATKPPAERPLAENLKLSESDPDVGPTAVQVSAATQSPRSRRTRESPCEARCEDEQQVRRSHGFEANGALRSPAPTRRAQHGGTPELFAPASSRTGGGLHCRYGADHRRLAAMFELIALLA